MVVEEVKFGNTMVYFYDDFICQDSEVVESVLNSISEIICENN